MSTAVCEPGSDSVCLHTCIVVGSRPLSTYVPGVPDMSWRRWGREKAFLCHRAHVILRLPVKDEEIVSHFGASPLLVVNNPNATIIGRFSFLRKKDGEVHCQHPHLQGT